LREDAFARAIDALASRHGALASETDVAGGGHDAHDALRDE